MANKQAPKFLRLKPRSATVPTAAQISSGCPLSKVRVLQVMESDDWEEFTVEWLSSRETPIGEYLELRRYGGSGDMGLDVVAFTGDDDFDSEWDSYQCKSYRQRPLQPGDVYVELGKIIYYSFSRIVPFNKTCNVPRRHVFVAPQGVGTTLSHFLKNPDLLREKLRENWDKSCRKKIRTGVDASLDDDLLRYFNSFDFSVFDDVTPATLVKEHSTTRFHVSRFGGGLPPRPDPNEPPAEPSANESRYIRKMLDAYGEHLGIDLSTRAELVQRDLRLGAHLERQRELFYCAESLHSYSRDTLPEAAFESLQEEVHDGVFETYELDHESGHKRMRATVDAAGALPLVGNALGTVAKVRDKQGICHQLANADRLTWVQKNA